MYKKNGIPHVNFPDHIDVTNFYKVFNLATGTPSQQETSDQQRDTQSQEEQPNQEARDQQQGNETETEMETNERERKRLREESEMQYYEEGGAMSLPTAIYPEYNEKEQQNKPKKTKENSPQDTLKQKKEQVIQKPLQQQTYGKQQQQPVRQKGEDHRPPTPAKQPIQKEELRLQSTTIMSEEDLTKFDNAELKQYFLKIMYPRRDLDKGYTDKEIIEKMLNNEYHLHNPSGKITHLIRGAIGKLLRENKLESNTLMIMDIEDKTFETLMQRKKEGQQTRKPKGSSRRFSASGRQSF